MSSCTSLVIKTYLFYIFIDFSKIFFKYISFTFVISFTIYFAQNNTAVNNNPKSRLKAYFMIRIEFLVLIDIEFLNLLLLLLFNKKS